MRLPFSTFRIRLSGLNPERFLNLMKAQEIPLLNVRRESVRILACECYACDVAAISALADEKGWKLEEAVPLGLSAWAAWLKKRPGVPIGLVLMLIAMFTLPRFVWRVEVRGAGPYRADVVSYLAQSGYHAGIPRSTVDVQALEHALHDRYPRIAWFHAHVAGMTLVVEAVQGAPMPALPETRPGDLVASQNGIIHSVLVYAGTPEVQPGDVVQKGDVLIRGMERARDGAYTPVAASGVVMARCWQSAAVHMPLIEVRSTETGRSHTEVRIHTPWFQWPKTDGPDYLTSALTITQTPVAGVFLPVYRQTLTWREVMLETIPRKEEDVRREAAEAALKQLKTGAFEEEIIDKWVDYCMIEGDTLAATATAERLVDIGAFEAP